RVGVIWSSIPNVQKQALITSRRRGSFWRSVLEPMVVAKTRPSLPDAPLYVRTQTTGIIGLFLSMVFLVLGLGAAVAGGSLGFMPARTWPWTRTVALSGRLRTP